MLPSAIEPCQGAVFCPPTLSREMQPCQHPPHRRLANGLGALQGASCKSLHLGRLVMASFLVGRLLIRPPVRELGAGGCLVGKSCPSVEDDVQDVAEERVQRHGHDCNGSMDQPREMNCLVPLPLPVPSPLSRPSSHLISSFALHFSFSSLQLVEPCLICTSAQASPHANLRAAAGPEPEPEPEPARARTRSTGRLTGIKVLVGSGTNTVLLLLVPDPNCSSSRRTAALHRTTSTTSRRSRLRCFYNSSSSFSSSSSITTTTTISAITTTSSTLHGRLQPHSDAASALLLRPDIPASNAVDAGAHTQSSLLPIYRCQFYYAQLAISADAIIAASPDINMAGLFRKVYDWLLRMFCLSPPAPAAAPALYASHVLTKSFRAMEMEVTMVGLQNAGKTSLLRVLAGGEFTLDSIPTVGFNMKRVQRGHVTLKCWDIGGQPRFRTMWERYCRGVSAIVFIVDIADVELIPQAKEELHELMRHKSLAGIPLLLLGNKSDLHEKLSVDELIDELDLKSIQGREVCCYGISAKEETNLDAVVNFLMKWANRA
ncbi:hypothetical protein G7046_g1504 [Stylonectria norvegica]|nr:hypothetical protein G7046_g1504 [Stylonectria norvegica]